MKIEHIALWVRDIENMKNFYETYFSCTAGQKYCNSEKNFESFFLKFDDGTRLELMKIPESKMSTCNETGNCYGYTHIAMSCGSKNNVISMTDSIKKAGFTVISEPRKTGDGYFESVILDPEGNIVEITS